MTGWLPKAELPVVNLVRLPPAGETGILLLDFGDDTPHSITSRKALEIIRKAI